MRRDHPGDPVEHPAGQFAAALVGEAEFVGFLFFEIDLDADGQR